MWTLRWIAAWLFVVLAPAYGFAAQLTGVNDSSRLDMSAAHCTLLRYEPLQVPLFYRVKAWRILYATRDYADHPVASSDFVVLSDYASVASNQPIVAWAHPLTGIAQTCAPSQRSSPVTSIAGINELIVGGYVVVATNYPGFGTTGPTGLLVGESQGQAVLDSGLAAQQIPEIGAGTRFALWGYPQGGHAALFASANSKNYTPKLSLVGTTVAAPHTNVKELLQDASHSINGRILMAMAAQSRNTAFRLLLKSLVNREAVPAIAKISSTCLNSIGSTLALLADQQALSRAFLNISLPVQKTWTELLCRNSPVIANGMPPIFISQGGNDNLVKPNVTAQFIGKLCSSENKVMNDFIGSADYENIARLSAVAAISWIGDRFEYKPVINSCMH